jgi:hypothetical protein
MVRGLRESAWIQYLKITFYLHTLLTEAIPLASLPPLPPKSQRSITDILLGNHKREEEFTSMDVPLTPLPPQLVGIIPQATFERILARERESNRRRKHSEPSKEAVKERKLRLSYILRFLPSINTSVRYFRGTSLQNLAGIMSTRCVSLCPCLSADVTSTHIIP